MRLSDLFNKLDVKMEAIELKALPYIYVGVLAACTASGFVMAREYYKRETPVVQGYQLVDVKGTAYLRDVKKEQFMTAERAFKFENTVGKVVDVPMGLYDRAKRFFSAYAEKKGGK